MQFFILDEHDLALQSAYMRIQELESLILRHDSRTFFDSVFSREPPRSLPAVHSRPISAYASNKMFPTTERDRERGFENPFSDVERGMLDALHAQDARSHDDAPPPDGDPSESSSRRVLPTTTVRASVRKIKKGTKDPYKIKNAEMRLPQYPNAITFQSWRRAIRTAAVSACEKPKRTRTSIFFVESENAIFDSLSVGDCNLHRALDAKLANALLKIVKGDLARRLAVISKTLAKRGRVLGGRHILFLIYREFRKGAHVTDVQSYSHLEKIQGTKEMKELESFLAI